MDHDQATDIPEEAAQAVGSMPSDAADHLAVLVNSGPDPPGTWERVIPVLSADPSVIESELKRKRLVAIASASRALSRTLAQHPELIEGAPAASSVTLQLRAALVSIAGDDLGGTIDMTTATARFSDAVDQMVQVQLEAAVAAVGASHPAVTDLPFAVIAMGKWGARELNYASDVDLIFVHDPGDLDRGTARIAAQALASKLVANLSAATFDGAALRVDADLRPEGAMGPLSRSIESCERYYREWAEAWELQALLKARQACGDSGLGARFIDLAGQVVWDVGLDAEALRSIRRIKEQTEAAAPSDDIKRSRGGIRDIEFTTQILQLVHGRLDQDLRVPGTLQGLAALYEHGYILGGDHDSLSGAYRFLRELEHRIQLWDLRQTHKLPAASADRSRIAKSLGLGSDPADLDRHLALVRSEVRDIHERLYFRPILDALVGSPTARIGIEQASLRLEALGFKDISSAAAAVEELTSGITRRSRVMNQMLPLMLDWLSLSPDPDMGLRQLRTLLAHAVDHSSLITLLQNNPLAGERLCQLLGTGRLLGTFIDRIPEFVPRLADDRLLGEIRDAEGATARLVELLDSRLEPDAKMGTIRRFARRRKLRVAAREVLAGVGPTVTLAGLSDTADAVVRGGVHMLGDELPTRFAVVAMGKWGGRELSYESDLDLMYVFGDEDDRDQALWAAGELGRVLSEPSRHGDAYLLDASIRPEGKNGPMARSLDSYRRYYEEWGEPWELLALIKARPVAGDPDVCRAFMATIEPILWQERIGEETLRAIRAIKARVESERIPPGEDPDYHLKLGRGGLSDVEFLTQLLQLQHGGSDPDLRVTGTLDGLSVLREKGHLTQSEFRTLEAAYLFCTRLRLRLHLQTGKVNDSLPTDRDALGRVATSLGYDRSTELREDYRRVTRRARQVFEERFF